MATSIVPPICDSNLAGRAVEVETEAAHEMVRRLVREEDLLVEIFAAAVVAAARIAGEVHSAGSAAIVVTILPDSSEKYPSECFWGGSVSTLHITQEVFEAIRRHGERIYPHECCGALLGVKTVDGWQVTAWFEAENMRTDSAHSRYQISPLDLVRIEQTACESGLAIAGFYHSHPDHPALWSVTDFNEAHWLGSSYVITAVEKGIAAVTNSFALVGVSEEAKGFKPEMIEVTE